MKILVLMAAWTICVQDPKKPDPAQAHPKVDQKRVDEAIKKGVAYLRTKLGSLPTHRGPGDRDVGSSELVLWTFLHAGVLEDDAEFQKLLKAMLESKLERTYQVALQAMILEELDRVKYQRRIAQCAQFLVDNQCKNGQWAYGDPSAFVDDIPTTTETGKRPDVTTGGAEPSKPKEYDPSIPRNRREKPKVTRKLIILKRRDGPESGDNSNTQYAALGLRACADAGIQFETKVLRLAQQWWRDSQHKADKDKEKEKGTKTGERVAADARGWCYGGKDHGHPAYGSMTAGAVGSLVIFDHLLGQKWKHDPDVLSGLQWLIDNFSVKENLGPCEWDKRTSHRYYYYLYALERAGVLFGTEKLGSWEWYPEGANVLLAAQKKDGSWSNEDGTPVYDTCFAILFLRRATRPFEDVATVDKKPQK